ncbi:MAG: aldo/keto reductase [Planctomycetaceae bacterium]|nr:aldo/keto reductase [Planctomycetaceae bacterium]
MTDNQQHRTIKLASGEEIPSVGLGHWKIPKDQTASIVHSALEIGYRHLDCACDYGNEAEAGAGLKQAINDGICRRDDVWVTSKLWNTYHRPEHVRAACERSLNDLQIDTLDLYMIHFPISLAFVPFEERYPPEWFFDPNAASPQLKPDPVPIAETWGAMQELVEAGLVRTIGVCNFGTSLLRDLLASASIRPAVLQVEMHPQLTQQRLLRYCQSEGIAVTAFSPLGAGSYIPLGMAGAEESLLSNSVVNQIAESHNRTAAQILLRWGVQRGTAVIPKSQRIERLRENLNIFDFALSEDQMTQLDSLNQNRRYNDPGQFCEEAFNTFFPIFD